MSTFSGLGLTAEREAQLATQGITVPSEVQLAAIPELLAGRHAMLQAPTGTGKTLAYLLPALQRLNPDRPEVQVLVLVPTQELGIQVRDVVKSLTDGTPIGVVALIGGANPARQAEQMKKLPRVVVGTPGRVLEFMRNGRLKGPAVKVLVVDEVDVQIEAGKIKDLETIFKATSPSRQMVFCSATLGEQTSVFAQRWLKDPAEIKVEAELKVPASIKHVAFVESLREKLPKIRGLLNNFNPVGALAFVNQTKDIAWLVNKLKHHNMKVEGLHSGVLKNERADIMRRFRAGDLQLLITTDLAARGLDLSGVSMVFNLDLPHDPETYVHRVGRTGRMGREGTAVTLVEPAEAFVLDKIEKALGISFERPVYRFGEVREKTEIDERREASKARAEVRKEKAKAEAPAKKKKKPVEKSASSKAVAKGKAKKAMRQAYGNWKKASRPEAGPTPEKQES